MDYSILGEALGSIVGAVIIQMITRSVFKKFGTKSLVGIVLLPAFTAMLFITVLAGYGLADGTEPQFFKAFLQYLPGTLLGAVFGYYSFKENESVSSLSKGFTTIVAFAGAGIATYLIISENYRKPVSFADKLKEIAAKEGEGAPKKIDEVTTITSIDIESKGLAYNYTVDFTWDELNDLSSTLKSSVIANVCDTPTVYIHHYSQAEITYRYSPSSEPEKSYNFSVTPKDCEN